MNLPLEKRQFFEDFEKQEAIDNVKYYIELSNIFNMFQLVEVRYPIKFMLFYVPFDIESVNNNASDLTN